MEVSILVEAVHLQLPTFPHHPPLPPTHPFIRAIHGTAVAVKSF